MVIPEPQPRKHIHTRAIDYRGYQREDNLWDIEAHMTDIKTYPIRNNWRGQLEVGEPLHEMLIRITIDNNCLLYTSPSPRDLSTSRMPSSA